MLKQNGTVRPHLPSNGRCTLEHVPSGQSATLILDNVWPWRSPVIEAANGERFRVSDSSWVPGMRLVDLVPSFFSELPSEWGPTRSSEYFEP